jgi:hypothetical protein
VAPTRSLSPWQVENIYLGNYYLQLIAPRGADALSIAVAGRNSTKHFVDIFVFFVKKE